MEDSIYRKYNITKADGTPVDQQAKYFCIRYDRHSKDPIARKVLRVYAWLAGWKSLEHALDLEES